MAKGGARRAPDVASVPTAPVAPVPRRDGGLHTSLLDLQRTVGNRATTTLVQRRTTPATRPPKAAATTRPVETWHAVRETLYLGAGLIVFDLQDGGVRSLEATHGDPRPGSYLLRPGPDGLTPTESTGAKKVAGELQIRWVAPPGVHIEHQPPVLLTVKTGKPPAELLSGSAPDGGDRVVGAPGGPLRFSKASGLAFGSSGDDRTDRLVGDHILAWARLRASAMLGTPAQTRRLQVEPGIEQQLVDAVHLHLVRRIVDGSSTDPESGRSEPDDFEGTPAARERAVADLERRWDVVSVDRALRSLVARSYQDEFLGAVNATSANATLIVDPEEIARIRTKHTTVPLRTNREGIVVKIGEAWDDRRRLVDHDSVDGGTRNQVWYERVERPGWYYLISTDSFRASDPGLTSVFGQVHANTGFAAMLLPWMVKLLGTGMTLAGPLSAQILGVALTTLGEEGMKDYTGEKKRSPTEILEAIGGEALMMAVVHAAIHAPAIAGKVKAKLKPGETLSLPAATDAIAENAAGPVRSAVAAQEGPFVAREVAAGRVRPVTDPAFAGKGYAREVTIEVDGVQHVYREAPNGTWARDGEMLDLPLEHVPPRPTTMADAENLKGQLIDEQAADAFDHAGNLKPATIEKSTLITEGEKIGNRDVVEKLTSDGSKIADWGKYQTQPIRTRKGTVEIHFYRNKRTGKIDTTFDYKAKYHGADSKELSIEQRNANAAKFLRSTRAGR